MENTKTIVDEGIILEQKTRLSHYGYIVYYNPSVNKFVAEKGTEYFESESLSEIWFMTGGWKIGGSTK